MKNHDIYHEHLPEHITLWQRAMVRLWGEEGQVQWYEHSTRRLLMYGTLLRRYQIQPRGMLYVGAHCGQLLWVWLILGFRNVLMIEPQEEALQWLEKMTSISSGLSAVYDGLLDCEDPAQILIAKCAVGDRDGEDDLFVMSKSEMTSLQKPNVSAFKQKDISVVNRVKVSVRTIDSLLGELEAGGSAGRYNALYMNVQGAELKALKGARKTLETLDFIYLENNYRDRYEGSPASSDIDAFLDEFGFEAKWGIILPRVGNGFTAYVKKGR